MKSLLKVLMLGVLFITFGFTTPKESQKVSKDNTDSWVDNLMKNQIGYTFPIIKKVKGSYPDANIAYAYVYLVYGERGYRFMDMYIAVYQPRPTQTAVTFRVQMVSYPSGSSSYQRYIQIFMAPYAQDAHEFVYTGAYWTMGGDWEVWSYYS